MKRIILILLISLLSCMTAFAFPSPPPHGDGTNCAAGSYPLGVDMMGNAQDCTVDGTGTDDQTATEVTVTPAGDIASTNVQAALEELDGEKLATGGTAANSSQLETHAASYFQVALTNPLVQGDVDDVPVDGVTTAPISSNWAYDHSNLVPVTSAAAIDLTVAQMNKVIVMTGAGDVNIPADQCDTATGAWIEVVSTAAHLNSITSDDGADVFILIDGTELDIGDEVDLAGAAASRVKVRCEQANKWYVVGAIGTATDGEAAD